MTEPTSLPASSQDDIAQLARSIRFSLCAIVLGLSYLNICGALHISNFEQVFHDLLGTRPLPALATLAFRLRPLLIALSFAFPTAALAALFVRRLSASIYLSGTLVLAVFVQIFFTWLAMFSPFVTIISGSGLASPPP